MRYNIIAIEREYASGGRELGEKVAGRLGIPCYGEKILEMAAEKMGKSVRELRDTEETITGSFLYGMYLMASAWTGTANGLTDAQNLSIVESDIIRQLAHSPCVFVGRCAAGVLRKEDRVLRVFAHADAEIRVKRAVQVYGDDPSQAPARLRKLDKHRAAYFKATAGVDWTDPEIYHLMLNSGLLEMDTMVEMLVGAAT